MEIKETVHSPPYGLVGVLGSMYGYFIALSGGYDPGQTSLMLGLTGAYFATMPFFLKVVFDKLISPRKSILMKGIILCLFGAIFSQLPFELARFFFSN